MRVTNEDGVYNLCEDRICLITGKGVWYEGLIFLVRVGMRGNLAGARRPASKSGSRGEGVGSGERRKGELWNDKIYKSSFLWVEKVAISATSKALQYGMSFENE